MYLETPRTTVRPFAPGDLDDLQEILGDAETMRFSQPPNTRSQTETFMREFCIQKQGGLAVARRADEKLIGYLLLREDSPAVYEMGWFFNRAVWRQGYAFESCHAVVEYVFRQLHARRIFAETADPVRSASLMRKLGMRGRACSGCRQSCRTAARRTCTCMGCCGRNGRRSRPAQYPLCGNCRPVIPAASAAGGAVGLRDDPNIWSTVTWLLAARLKHRQVVPHKLVLRAVDVHVVKASASSRLHSSAEISRAQGAPSGGSASGWRPGRAAAGAAGRTRCGPGPRRRRWR